MARHLHCPLAIITRAGLLAMLALAGCVNGGGDDGTEPTQPAGPSQPGNPPVTGFDIPLGEPGPTAYAHMQAYLDVVLDPANFDECLTSDPVTEWYKCLPGPRTGSGLGHIVHRWAADQFRRIEGLEAIQEQAFGFPIFKPRNYALTVTLDDGSPYEPAVFPWYFQGVTDAQGVTGALVDLGGGSLLDRLRAGDVTGKIVIFTARQVLNAATVGAQQALDWAAEQGAIGAIVAIEGPSNELVAQNYNTFEGLRELPTVVVGEFDGQRLVELAGQTAQLIVDATVAEPGPEGYSSNSYAFLPGQDREHLLVIGTPVNGWFTVGSERGPGVGGLIYLARYLADRAQREGPLPYTVVFSFTGAHEVLGFGQERVLQCLDPSRVASYVHLGAGLASRGYIERAGEPMPTGLPATQRALVISENLVLETAALAAFADVIATQVLTVSPGGVFNPGETQAAYALQIPTLGISGAGLFHHSPSDTIDKLSIDYLAPVIESYRDLVDQLLATDPASIRNANAIADSLAGDPIGFRCPGPVVIP